MKKGRTDKTVGLNYLIVKEGRRDKTVGLRYLIMK
jgi:hypothetical protein